MDTPPIMEITAHDRCDRCGAAAMIVATLLRGELLFCGHHGRKFRTQLTKQASILFDPKEALSFG